MFAKEIKYAIRLSSTRLNSLPILIVLKTNISIYIESLQGQLNSPPAGDPLYQCKFTFNDILCADRQLMITTIISTKIIM